MLGNDVIDLDLAVRQSNWRRKNYLPKIFTSKEQELVNLAEDPDLVVWRIWSMKEAAYKIVNRLTGLRSYNPKAFTCCFDRRAPLLGGIVCFQGEVFSCRTMISKDFIHTVALSQQIPDDAIEIICAPNQPGRPEFFAGGSGQVQLKKSEAMLPEIHDLGTGAVHTASLSHHGSWLCIVFLKAFNPTPFRTDSW